MQLSCSSCHCVYYYYYYYYYYYACGFIIICFLLLLSLVVGVRPLEGWRCAPKQLPFLQVVHLLLGYQQTLPHILI